MTPPHSLAESLPSFLPVPVAPSPALPAGPAPLSAEEIKLLRDAERAGRARMKALGDLSDAPLPVGAWIQETQRKTGIEGGKAHVGGEYMTPRRIHYCHNNCGQRVQEQGHRCADCDPIALQRKRANELADAYASICPPDPELCPEGVLTWCRAGLEEYSKSTARARALVSALPVGERQWASDIIVNAVWKRDHGNLILLGETGIGKSKVMAAIGLRLLDYALAGKLPDDAYRFARRIRWVTGLDLGNARAQTALGAGEPPLIAMAKRASLLLLDEGGYENDRFDPRALRDVIYARYDAGLPTILSSGKTCDGLDELYQAAMMRRLWEPGRGRVLDLHPRRAR